MPVIRLEAATVLLQWATGGMLFCWFTTRRRVVGLGYGWLLRGTYFCFAMGAFAAGLAFGSNPVREAASLGVAAACLAGLASSIRRRAAGVSGQQAEFDRRSERVAAMTGIERTTPRGTGGAATGADGVDVEPSVREFDPRWDLVPVAIGTVGIVAAAVLAGCVTGERPSFRDDEVESISTGSPAIDTVLQRLESVAGSRFTASYQIETKFGTLTSTAEVAQTSSQRTAVTVQNDAVHIRFVADGADERTCDLTADECETGLNDARISNTQLSHTFYGPSFARRLRVSADRRVGDPVPSTRTIAGQPAECVDVPVTGGIETFCALASGALAEFRGADVSIVLTSYSPEPDDALFDT